MLATALGGLAAVRFLVPPRSGFSVAGAERQAGLVLYAALGAGIALLGGAMRGARGLAEVEAAEASRQREALRTTLGSIGDAVIATDGDGRVAFMNPVAESLTGWSQGEAGGRRLEDVFVIVNESSRATAPSPVAKVLRTGQIQGLANHTTLIARDGTERPIDDSAAPIRDGAGAISGVVLVFRDVTSRRRAEQALARGEERLRLALDAARMVVWEWTTADGSLRVSENAAEVFGLPRGTTLVGIDQGLPLVHPDDLPDYRRAFGRAIEGRGGYVTEYRLVRPDDGAVIWIEERGHAAPPEGGGGVRLVGVALDVTERRRSEAELLRLREAEGAEGRRAVGILENIADGFFAVDSEWRVSYVNPQFERILGQAAGEVLGRELWDVYPGLDGSEFGRIYRRVAATRAAESATAYYPAFGRWFEFHAYPAADGLSVYFRDVTDRERAEAERARLAAESDSERRIYHTALSNTPDLVYVFDLDHRFIYANEALLAMWGRTWEEAIGKDCLELGYEPWHAEMHGREIDEVVATRRPVRGEVPFSGAGGRRVYEYIFTPALGADGAVQAVAGTTRDVTDRLRAEAEIREKDERLNLLVENIKDYAVIVTDPEGTVIEWQGGAEKITGFTPAEVVGRKAHLIFTPEDRAAGVPELEMARSAGAGRAEDRRWHLRSDGSRFFADGVMTALYDEGAKLRGFGKVFKDATGEKQAEAERSRLEQDLRQIAADLSDADHRKDEFLATLAHELRNPLAPIRNGLQVMKLAGGDPRTVEESRALMERQVTHMVRLIDDLMDVSRITRNKLELRRERVDLAEVVRSAVEASRPLVEEAGHELAVTLPARPIYVDADATRLAQVFSNLLHNAAKYTEQGGDIALAAERQGSDAVVTVRDNGVGIPAEMLPRVFEMFTQVDRSLERSQGGLGIGLSLVRTLVGLHGGSVEARSGGQGCGSEFVVRLPVVLTAAAVPRAEAGPASPAASLHILVVDDNLDSARTLARLLKLLGHEARTAHDGGEAVEVAEAYRPELILLDIGLPVLNGYDVARAIRGRPWGAGVRIVALTGWGQEGDRRRSKDAGIDDHLVKPVDPAILETLLAGVGQAR